MGASNSKRHLSCDDMKESFQNYNHVAFSQRDDSSVDESHDNKIESGAGDRFIIEKESHERYSITNASPQGKPLYVDSYEVAAGEKISLSQKSYFIYDKRFSEESKEGPSFIYGFNPAVPELFQLSPENRGCSVSADGFTKKFYIGSNKYVGVENISFEIRPAEFVGIYGNSGTGKTVLIESLVAPKVAGKRKKSKKTNKGGDLLIDKKQPKQVADCVAYLPQHIQFPKQMRCKELLKLGYADRRNSYDHADVLEILRLCSLSSDILNERCGRLSGGQLRRLALAMTLLNKKIRLIVADEPTSGLDIANEMEIMRALRALSRSRGITVIVVTHAVAALRLFDRVMVLRKESDEKGASLSFNSLWVDDSFPPIFKDTITQDAARIAFLSSRISAFQMEECKERHYFWPFCFGEFFKIRKQTTWEKWKSILFAGPKWIKDTLTKHVFGQFCGWTKNTLRLIFRQQKSLLVFLLLAVCCVLSLQLGISNGTTGAENLLSLMSLCAPWLCATYATVFVSELLSTYAWEYFSGLKARAFTFGVLAGLIVPSVLIALVFTAGTFFQVNNEWFGKQAFVLMEKANMKKSIWFFFSEKSFDPDFKQKICVNDKTDIREFEREGRSLRNAYDDKIYDLDKALKNKQITEAQHASLSWDAKQEFEAKLYPIIIDYHAAHFKSYPHRYRFWATPPQYRVAESELGTKYSQGYFVLKSEADATFNDIDDTKDRTDMISPFDFFMRQWGIMCLIAMLGATMGVAAIAAFRDVKSSTIGLVILFIAFMVFSRTFITEPSYMFSLSSIPNGELRPYDIKWVVPILISFCGIGRYIFNVLSYPATGCFLLDWIPLAIWWVISVVIAMSNFANKNKNWRMISR